MIRSTPVAAMFGTVFSILQFVFGLIGLVFGGGRSIEASGTYADDLITAFTTCIPIFEKYQH